MRLIRSIAPALVFTMVSCSTLVSGQATQTNQKHVHYSLTILDSFGGTFTVANGINRRGAVAGTSLLSNETDYHAYLGTQDGITDIGTLGGPNSNVAESAMINDRDEIVGFSDTTTADPNGEDFCNLGTSLVCAPFVWSDGEMRLLPTLGGNNAWAIAINNRGDIVGQSETSNFDACSPNAQQVEAVIWKNGSVYTIPGYAGDPDGYAGGINNRGDIVYFTGCITGAIHALLWRDNQVVYLGSLGGITGNFPSAINNRDQVVGESDLAGDTLHHAFLWDKGVMRDLGTLPGLPTSSAIGLNNKGQIVGQSQDANSNPSSSVAVLWDDGHIFDLNNLVPASPWFLMEALGINDRGVITGFAGNPSTGVVRGFLLTPCDENGASAQSCSERENASTVLIAPANRPKIILSSSARRQFQAYRHSASWSRSNRFRFPALGPRN